MRYFFVNLFRRKKEKKLYRGVSSSWNPTRGAGRQGTIHNVQCCRRHALLGAAPAPHRWYVWDLRRLYRVCVQGQDPQIDGPKEEPGPRLEARGKVRV